MYGNDNLAKNACQSRSRKSSLQDGGHDDSDPPSKKRRIDDDRAARVESDDVWGEDLDANTVEECFVLASQALSQACSSETARTREQPQKWEPPQRFQTPAAQPFRPKHAAFTRNVLSASKWTDKFQRKVPSTGTPSNVFPRNGPLSSRQPESLPRDDKKPAILPKPKGVETLSTEIPSSAEPKERNAVTYDCWTSPGSGPSAVASVSSVNNLNAVLNLDEKDSIVRELQQLKLAYHKLQDRALTKDGEVSILRTQLNSKNVELETERLSKAREIEVQAQEFRGKMKDLQQELVQLKTQLEFKTLEVGSAQERCRLLESQSKVRLVEPQPSQTPQKFPKKLPMKGSPSTSSAPQKPVDEISTLSTSLKSMKLEIHISEGPMLSRLVTPALFEKPVRGTETTSCLGIKQKPLTVGEYGEHLTPRGSTVNVTHTSISKLVLMDSIGGESARRLIRKVVWQCYLILATQRDLLELHKPPQNIDKLKDYDLKMSAAAGRLFGGKASIMTARPWYKNEQGMETRRTLGLMAALAMMSQYAAEHMSGMIWCKRFATKKKLKKKRFSKKALVRRNWLEPCKPVHPSKLKHAPMSNKVKMIVEKRILTNLAISKARASIRAAKRENARLEAEKAKAELEQKTALSESVSPKTSRGSRRLPNLLVVYKKYLERCKVASEAKVKKRIGQGLIPQDLPPYLAAQPSTSWMSELDKPHVTSATAYERSVKYRQKAPKGKSSAKKVKFNESLPGPSNRLSSKSSRISKSRSRKKEKSLEKMEPGPDRSTVSLPIDQPGTSKESASSDDHLFKKPFPVKRVASSRKTTRNKPGKKKVKVRNRKYVVKKMSIISRISRLKCLHPSVIASQKKNAARISKLFLKKSRPPQKKRRCPKKGKARKAVDLLEMLHDIVRFICDQRLSVKFNGVLLGVTQLLRIISCRVNFKEGRCPVLARIVRDVILCRPSVNVLMELTDLLFSLGKYSSIMQTLCRGTGPSPYLGGTIGVVYFVEGKPQYDLGSNEEVEYFGKDSCMIALLCWMLLVQRARIKQYVVLASNVIKWLVCVSRQQKDGPYWIGPNHPGEGMRKCQCRARIIEATIMLLHLCFLHIRKNNFRKDRLFRDIRHLLGRGLLFLHHLVHQDKDVGLLMANAEGEYQVLIHGFIENLKIMNLDEQEEEALKALKDFEDQQDVHAPTLNYTVPTKVVMDDIFKTIESFCGPAYK